MGTLVRRVDEVSAMVFVPLVLAEPLLGPIAIPFHTLFSVENIFALASAIRQIQSARVSANLRAIAEFSVVGFRAGGSFGSSFVRILPHDVTGRCVVADESVFVSPAPAANVSTTHSSTLGPNQLCVMTALGNLSVFITHGVTRLSGEIVTLTFIVPKLDGPHEPLNGAWITVPEKDVLADWILF